MSSHTGTPTQSDRPLWRYHNGPSTSRIRMNKTGLKMLGTPRQTGKGLLNFTAHIWKYFYNKCICLILSIWAVKIIVYQELYINILKTIWGYLFYQKYGLDAFLSYEQVIKVYCQLNVEIVRHLVGIQGTVK